VTAGGADALVLEIDPAGRLECLFEPHCADQRGRAPDLVEIADRFRNRNPTPGVHFLLDQRIAENGGEVGGRQRLAGARMERRRQRLGEVREDIVPSGGDFIEG
jgi:hypothetical protein